MATRRVSTYSNAVRDFATRARPAAVDLRSDTVTKPCSFMRKAMQAGRVGDDVYGEDPDVNALQRKVARMLNKEAGLFVPSGTQSNLIAVGTHCNRGEEIILGHSSHIFVYEGGGASAHLGVSMKQVPNNSDGTLIEFEGSIRPRNNVHYPRTRCVALENTHNVCGGVVVPQTHMLEVKKVCVQHGLALHLDGARLWNASIASKTSMAELVEPFDSVSVCFSKGLGAPVGSMLVGNRKFIDKARYLRKSLGGGLRQAGILAAGALYALENNIERLRDDHIRAKSISATLKLFPNVFKMAAEPETNILYFEVAGGQGKLFTDWLKNEYGVLMGSYGTTRVRAVTHLGIGDEALDRTNDAIKNLANSLF